MGTILYLIRHHWIAFGVFVTASAVALFFLTQAVLGFIWMHDPRNQDPEITAWMTPRFVSMSYRLPMDEMMGVLDLEPRDGARKTLAEIAEERGTTVEALAETLMAAVEEHRAQHRKEPRND